MPLSIEPSSSLRPEEIHHFSHFSGTWWDERGPFSLLHQINPVRLRFIRDQVCAHFKKISKNPSRMPFKGLRFLDVGCGGGLLTEPLQRMGAEVVGIDATAPNIDVAQAHAIEQGLSIFYQATTVENFQDTGNGFDVVIALEIVEHVRDPFSFIQSCTTLLRPGGMILLSTLNRTFLSYLLGIVAAESILGWVPKGTHHWDQFVKPEEMEWFLKRSGFDILQFKGMRFHPLTRQWTLADDKSINYLVSGARSA